MNDHEEGNTSVRKEKRTLRGMIYGKIRDRIRL